MIISVCPAPRHGTWHTLRRYGCTCPDARQDNRRRVRESNAQRRYIPGRHINRYGRRAGLDEIAVERAIGGDRSVVLTAEERRAAIDQLDRYGLSAAEVATRLGTTVRTVQRQRARRRAAQSMEASAR